MARLPVLKLDRAMSLAEPAAGASLYGVPAHGVVHPDASGAGLRLRPGQASQRFRRRPNRQGRGNDQEHCGGFDHGRE